MPFCLQRSRCRLESRGRRKWAAELAKTVSGWQSALGSTGGAEWGFALQNTRFSFSPHGKRFPFSPGNNPTKSPGRSGAPRPYKDFTIYTMGDGLLLPSRVAETHHREDSTRVDSVADARGGFKCVCLTAQYLRERILKVGYGEVAGFANSPNPPMG